MEVRIVVRVRTIGRLAAETGVGIQTIRFYEREGLLEQPTRPESGWRAYDDGSVKLVHFIKRAQALGFSLAISASC